MAGSGKKAAGKRKARVKKHQPRLTKPQPRRKAAGEVIPNRRPPRPPAQPVPPSSTDDATNKVVQAYADRQRNFIAATSSGTTGVPLPLKQWELRNKLLQRIRLLEETLAKLPTVQHPSMGHNKPPEPIEVSFSAQDHKAVEQAIAVLKEPQATSAVALNSISTLTKIAKKIWRQLARGSGYFGKKADEFVSAAVRSGGAEFGKRAIQAPFWYELARNLHSVSQAAIDWITTLPH